jgi:hypothetical protein
MLGAAGAEFVYEGECRDESVPSKPAPIPNNCKSFFDGCNTCGRETLGGPVMCTQMACTEYKPAYCTAYFPSDTPAPSAPVSRDDPYDASDYMDYPDDYLPNATSSYEVGVTSEEDVREVANKSVFKRFIEAIANFISSLFGA